MTVYTNATPLSGGGGGWQTAYSVDFTALATGGSAVMSNGANTIDGKTWYVENSANADEFRVVNGSGLVIDPNATASDFFNNTRTAPLISAKLIDLNASLIWQRCVAYRAQVLWTSNGTLDANFETFSFGIECPFQPSSGQQWTDLIARGFDSGNGNACWWFGTTRAGSTTRGTPNTARTTDDISCVLHRGMGLTEFYTATSSGGDFPTDDNYYLRALSQPSGNALITIPAVTAINTQSLVIAAYPNNTSNALRIAIKKFKLEYI